MVIWGNSNGDLVWWGERGKAEGGRIRDKGREEGLESNGFMDHDLDFFVRILVFLVFSSICSFFFQAFFVLFGWRFFVN